jgi:hypothetical protein
MTNKFQIIIIGILIFTNLKTNAQTITLSKDQAIIENINLAIKFDLETGTYSGIDKTDNTIMFQDAKFLLDRGSRMWKTPKQIIRAEEIDAVNGKKLRVWYIPQEGYDPTRFLDVTLTENMPYVLLGWGVKNDFNYEIRVRDADVLFQGKLFENQGVIEPKVLRGGAGAEPNFVEDTWQINAVNSIMLTYKTADAEETRKTLVVGGAKYEEFFRMIETYQGEKKGTTQGDYRYEGTQPYITLTISDLQGKRIPPNETWESKDDFYLNFITTNPFNALEDYGKILAEQNNANPNVYNFPTLCGWMVSTSRYGEGIPINNSPALVEQMELAHKSGLNKYTSLAVRLEPDYYCQHNQGNTQQGWWDDEHWAKYGSLIAPYETFSMFADAVEKKGGQVFTYFQASMPSNDFALAHPDWMLNDDISLLHVDHYHHRPLIRYDYTNPDFQAYLLDMWKRLSGDGVKGIKFDYPETAWAWQGGFDDKTYTTTSAYKKLFELCREGMGKDAYIHERNLGNNTHENVYRLDCTVGTVDLQRVWSDASHFEPEMASRIGLRWYKQGVAFRYYPDGKSFYFEGNALDIKKRRTILTLIGLLSGRIELGTSFGSMTDQMIFDLTRLYPSLPNGKSFRPVDFLTGKKHPEVYVYDVSNDWKQIILANNDEEASKSIVVPISGNQVTTGSMGLDSEKKYIFFDFWNQKALGVLSGRENFIQKLAEGEALVYSVKEMKNHPQILATNRHIMCGMFEIKNEKWDENNNELSFSASLIEGEKMTITLYLPEDKQMKVSTLIADNAESSYVIKNNYLTISLVNGEKNTDSNVVVKFQ